VVATGWPGESAVDFAHTRDAEQARHRKAQILARWCYDRGILAEVSMLAKLLWPEGFAARCAVVIGHADLDAVLEVRRLRACQRRAKTDQTVAAATSTLTVPPSALAHRYFSHSDRTVSVSAPRSRPLCRTRPGVSLSRGAAAGIGTGPITGSGTVTMLDRAW